MGPVVGQWIPRAVVDPRVLEPEPRRPLLGVRERVAAEAPEAPAVLAEENLEAVAAPLALEDRGLVV